MKRIFAWGAIIAASGLFAHPLRAQVPAPATTTGSATSPATTSPATTSPATTSPATAPSSAPKTGVVAPSSYTARPNAGAPVAQPVSEPPASPVRLPFVRFSPIRPEWSYRWFRNREPSTTDKTYDALGVAGLAWEGEIYPFGVSRNGPVFWRDLAITGSYGQAVDLVSVDIDKDFRDDQVAPTYWYRVNAGLKFRALGRGNPLSLTVAAEIERWVFDFEYPSPPRREIPTARYTLLPIGAGLRYDLKPVAFLADARFVLPLSIAPLGDRTPSGGNFGVRASGGFAFVLSRFFEVDVRATYNLFTFSLPVVANRADQRGSVVDRYLTLSAGVTVSF